jgi:hypothetical protein
MTAQDDLFLNNEVYHPRHVDENADFGDAHVYLNDEMLQELMDSLLKKILDDHPELKPDGKLIKRYEIDWTRGGTNQRVKQVI